LQELGRLANKSNKITRARVDSLTRAVSKGPRASMANFMLPWNQEGEAMVQCEKELRECGRLANKSNISTTARVNSSTREGSK